MLKTIDKVYHESQIIPLCSQGVCCLLSFSGLPNSELMLLFLCHVLFLWSPSVFSGSLRRREDTNDKNHITLGVSFCVHRIESGSSAEDSVRWRASVTTASARKPASVVQRQRDARVARERLHGRFNRQILLRISLQDSVLQKFRNLVSFTFVLHSSLNILLPSVN